MGGGVGVGEGETTFFATPSSPSAVPALSLLAIWRGGKFASASGSLRHRATRVHEVQRSEEARVLTVVQKSSTMGAIRSRRPVNSSPISPHCMSIRCLPVISWFCHGSKRGCVWRQGCRDEMRGEAKESSQGSTAAPLEAEDSRPGRRPGDY